MTEKVNGCILCGKPLERYIIPGTGGQEMGWRLTCEHPRPVEASAPSKSVTFAGFLECPLCEGHGQVSAEVMNRWLELEAAKAAIANCNGECGCEAYKFADAVRPHCVDGGERK